MGYSIIKASQLLFLREVSFILLIGATLHFVAVSHLYFTDGFPSHDRAAYVYFIGLIQVAAGLLNILSWRSLRDRDAVKAQGTLGISVALITGYVAIVTPVYPDFSFAFKLAPPSYLLYHWWAFIKLRSLIRAGSTPLR
jgi:hypothetical protein